MRRGGPSSPYGSDSFELGESMGSVAGSLVNRTPKVLSGRSLAHSASSVASIDESMEGSLRRSVTFSTRQSAAVSQPPRAPAQPAQPAQQRRAPAGDFALEIASDEENEYSMDFDEAAQLASSASYAEDFDEPSTSMAQPTPRSQSEAAPTFRGRKT